MLFMHSKTTYIFYKLYNYVDRSCFWKSKQRPNDITIISDM